MNKIKNIFQDRQAFTQILYFACIAAIYGILSLLNFSEASFEFERLKDYGFWFQYIITLSFATIGFLLMAQARKIHFSRREEIIRLTSCLSAYYEFLRTNDGLWKKFKEWIKRDNRKTKIEIYIEKIQRKREKTKSEEEIDKLDSLIENAEKDIDRIQVDYTQKTTSLIFSGVTVREKNREYLYSGYEAVGEFLLPTMIWGLFITSLSLTFVLVPKETNLDAWIQLLIRFTTILTYTLKGSSFAEYSVLTKKKNALENRLADVSSFLDEEHCKTEIADNPYYAFKVEKR